jgi:hypothetical protein
MGLKDAPGSPETRLFEVRANYGIPVLKLLGDYLITMTLFSVTLPTDYS